MECPRCKTADPYERYYDLPIPISIPVCLDCITDWHNMFHAEQTEIVILEIEQTFRMDNDKDFSQLERVIRKGMGLIHKLNNKTLKWISDGTE
ncbi:MAG: hypothetical protein KGN01_05570 [Patescibacteria group bacterium]|nr:hypothetical protein [Patescibacteria group bacterium]